MTSQHSLPAVVGRQPSRLRRTVFTFALAFVAAVAPWGVPSPSHGDEPAAPPQPSAREDSSASRPADGGPSESSPAAPVDNTAAAYRYAAQISAAQHALRDGQLARSAAILDATRPEPGAPDFRGLEWNHLSRLTHASLAEFSIEHSPRDLLFSPDGRSLAVASYGHVKVWSISSGELQRHIATKGMPQCLAFSPDGQQLVTADGVGNLEYESTIRAWNLATRQEHTVATCLGSVLDLAFAPDGERLAATIVLGPISIFAAPELPTSCGQVCLWDVDQGEQLLAIPMTLDAGKDRRKAYQQVAEALVQSVQFSPDGRRLSGMTAEGKVQNWKLPSGELAWEVSTGGGAFAYDTTGKLLELADLTLDADTGHVARRHDPARTWLASAYGRALWSDRHTIHVIDSSTRLPQGEIRASGAAVRGVAVSPDGWRIAVATDRDVQIYDAQGSSAEITLSVAPSTSGENAQVSGVKQAAISSDASRVATVTDGNPILSDAQIQIWDRITGMRLRRIEARGYQCTSLEFAPGKDQLAASFYGEGTFIWDIRSGALLHHFAQEGQFSAYSPDGTRLALIGKQPADDKEYITLRSTDTGEEVDRVALDWYSFDLLAFHPDNRHLAICGRGKWEQPGAWQEKDQLAIWDLVDRGVTRTDYAPGQQSMSLAFAADGSELAVATRQQVALLDASSLRLRTSLARGATQVAFGPDGRRLLLGADDDVTILDRQTLSELLHLTGASRGLSLTPDGTFLAAGVGYPFPAPGAPAPQAKVWDFRSPDRDDHVQQEVLGVLRYLTSRVSARDELLQYLQGDQTLSAAARRQAVDHWSTAAEEDALTLPSP